MKRLQRAADLSFRKTNGTHNFNYAIKKFSDSTGTRIKIIIVGETNMSDISSAWSNPSTNPSTSSSGKVTLVGAESGKENVTEYKLSTLEPTITVPVPEELANEKLHICVKTEWLFSGKLLIEELEFDLD